MNILVANISTLPRERRVLKYNLYFRNASADFIEACHTNESIARAFAAQRDIVDGGGVQRVIALTTNQVRTACSERFENMTAIEYYKQVVSSLWSDAEILTISVDDEEGMSKEPEEILHELVDLFHSADSVYVDAAGGRRTDANIILQTVKILQHIGVNNPMALYADIQTESCFIRDTSEFSHLENLSSALNEFMTTGKADMLSEEMQGELHREWMDLFAAMCDFSDCIRIGNVDNIDYVVKDIQKAIAKCENSELNDVRVVIIKRFLPIFKQRIIGEEAKVNYVRIIQWCIDNKLVQQALTIIVEKLPKYLIDHEYFKPRNASIRQKIISASEKNAIYHGNWEAYALYNALLENRENQDSRIEELRKVILGELPRNKACDSVKDAFSVLEKFKNRLEYDGDYSASGVKEIKEAIEKCKPTLYSYDQLSSKVANETPLLKALLGIKSDKKATLTKKLDAISQFEKSGASTDFTFASKLQMSKFVQVLYYYVYVKALRNQINHASSEDNLSDQDKMFLSTKGVDCSSCTMSVILKNLNSMMDSICSILQEKTDVVEKPVEFYGSIGDEVFGICVQPGIMQIDGLNYTVHLVVGREVDKRTLVGKSVQGKVMSFRKGTKVIADVRYVNPMPSLDLSKLTF